MIQGSKEEQYLNGRWQSQKEYYSKKSQQYKQWHQLLLITSSIGSVLVPIIVTTPQIPKIVSVILSVTVSIALILDNTLHFGDNWRTFRQTLEALKQERIYFENGLEPYADPHSSFPVFVNNCEQIMNNEGKAYFETQKAKEHTNGTKVG